MAAAAVRAYVNNSQNAIFGGGRPEKFGRGRAGSVAVVANGPLYARPAAAVVAAACLPRSPHLTRRSAEINAPVYYRDALSNSFVEQYVYVHT